jgi:predicted transcriptional regulator
MPGAPETGVFETLSRRDTESRIVSESFSHRTLGDLGQPNTPEGVLTPAVSVRQSVRPEFVICLDCGYRGRMLRRHINRHHGLTRDEYLKRWGLRHDHPLTAPAYSERRSILAKKIGLGRKATAEVARDRRQRYRPR